MVTDGFEIVYSRYAEPVDFLAVAPWPVTVYNKGDAVHLGGARVVDLPNYGMDTHSILHHCAERYDRLADVTLFLCGSFAKRPANYWSQIPTYRVAEAVGFAGARYHADEGWPGPIKHHSQWAEWLKDGTIVPSPHTLGEWWDEWIGGPRPERLWYVPGQTFSVRRDRVTARPRRWYCDLRDFFATHGRYPEETHHMERMWLYVFGGGA